MQQRISATELWPLQGNLVNEINSFHSIPISSFNHLVEIICSFWLDEKLETRARFSL